MKQKTLFSRAATAGILAVALGFAGVAAAHAATTSPMSGAPAVLDGRRVAALFPEDDGRGHTVSFPIPGKSLQALASGTFAIDARVLGEATATSHDLLLDLEATISFSYGESGTGSLVLVDGNLRGSGFLANSQWTRQGLLGAPAQSLAAWAAALPADAVTTNFTLTHNGTGPGVAIYSINIAGTAGALVGGINFIDWTFDNWGTDQWQLGLDAGFAAGYAAADTKAAWQEGYDSVDRDAARQWGYDNADTAASFQAGYDDADTDASFEAGRAIGWEQRMDELIAGARMVRIQMTGNVSIPSSIGDVVFLIHDAVTEIGALTVTFDFMVDRFGTADWDQWDVEVMNLRDIAEDLGRALGIAHFVRGGQHYVAIADRVDVVDPADVPGWLTPITHIWDIQE